MIDTSRFVNRGKAKWNIILVLLSLVAHTHGGCCWRENRRHVVVSGGGESRNPADKTNHNLTTIFATFGKMSFSQDSRIIRQLIVNWLIAKKSLFRWFKHLDQIVFSRRLMNRSEREENCFSFYELVFAGFVLQKPFNNSSTCMEKSVDYDWIRVYLLNTYSVIEYLSRSNGRDIFGFFQEETDFYLHCEIWEICIFRLFCVCLDPTRAKTVGWFQ